MSPMRYTKQTGRRFFYCKDRVTTKLTADSRWSIFQANGLFLAQKNHKTSGLSSTLAACDQQCSVLFMYEGEHPESQAYSPYGHHPRGGGVLSLLAFNGERPDTVTGHYHLGNGYRGFSPVMMRFCGPDSWSPFGAGGFNAYAYCAGDPTNRTDPTGHAWFRRFIGRLLNLGKPKAAAGSYYDRSNWVLKVKPQESLVTDLAKSFGNLPVDTGATDQYWREGRISASSKPNLLTRNSNGAERLLASAVPDQGKRVTVQDRRRAQEKLSRIRAIDRDTDTLEALTEIQKAGLGSAANLAEMAQLQENIRTWKNA